MEATARQRLHCPRGPGERAASRAPRDSLGGPRRGARGRPDPAALGGTQAGGLRRQVKV